MRKYEITFYKNNEVTKKEYYESPIYCLGAVIGHLDFMIEMGFSDRIIAKCGDWEYDSAYWGEDDDEEED